MLNRLIGYFQSLGDDMSADNMRNVTKIALDNMKAKKKKDEEWHQKLMDRRVRPVIKVLEEEVKCSAKDGKTRIEQEIEDYYLDLPHMEKIRDYFNDLGYNVMLWDTHNGPISASFKPLIYTISISWE